MKKQEIIKLNLDSLCVYKKIFSEKVGDKFSKLVDKIVQDSNVNEVISAYNDFTYELFKASKNLSFKESIVDEILLDHNPYSLGLELNGDVPGFTFQGIKSELQNISDILKISSKDIKELIIGKFSDDEVIKDRINSLIDWGIESIEYVPQNGMAYEKIKAVLMNTDNWGECIDELSEFYRDNGTGRASAYAAFVWERFDNEEEGHLREILEPDPIRLSDLIGYEEQQEIIKNNTINLLKGYPANNLLLYGSRGTGKSSTVKAILNEYYEQGLRLIEVDKSQLSDFTRIIRLLRHKKQKFIIFVDDLVFQEGEEGYSALKTILEGRIENRPDNILIYATTNRRHLIKEKFSDRDDIHYRDTQEEQLSLADRFGITVSFLTPNQNEFLHIVNSLVKSRNLEVDVEYIKQEAIKWSQWYNGRSPRAARQFVDWLEGQINNK